MTVTTKSRRTRKPKATPPTGQVSGAQFETVTLSNPIIRGETVLATINVRRPRTGELRGLSLQDIMNTDIVAMLNLIPRVTEPPLKEGEANNLDPADFAEITGTIRGFFMTKGEKAMIEAVMTQYQPKT